LPEEQKEEREAQLINLVNGFISKHTINKNKVSISVPRRKSLPASSVFLSPRRRTCGRFWNTRSPNTHPLRKKRFILTTRSSRGEGMARSLCRLYQEEEVDVYLALLKKVGIQPISIQIPSTAALNLFFYHKMAGQYETAVLLDVSLPFFEMNLIQGKDWKESFHLLCLPKSRNQRLSARSSDPGCQAMPFPNRPFSYLV